MRKATAAALAAIAAILFMGSVAIVGSGERGVITHFGAVQGRVLGEGLHLKAPFPFATVHNIIVRSQKVERDADAASKDLQTVEASVALNFHVDPATVNRLYQEVRGRYIDVWIEPAIQESVKAATAQFTAEELITKRPEVKGFIRDELAKRLADKHVVIEDLSITNFNFSAEFDAAIEEKQTAEQQALKAERDLERVKIEAEQKVARAKAEAEALRVQKSELTPDILQLRWIEKWNGVLPSYVGDASFLMNLK